MKVLVTGSDGFIGKNLIERLNRIEDLEIIRFTRNDNVQSLDAKIVDVKFIFHLAGVNRPENVNEFYEGNRDLTKSLAEVVLRSKRKIPILIASSTQVQYDNDYGRSKLEGELSLVTYAEKSGAAIYIYRLQNVFGKWSKPNYNTVIATWCYNITRGLPIEISDERAEVKLIYIDDVVSHFIKQLKGTTEKGIQYCEVSPVYNRTLGEIIQLLESFSQSREDLSIQRVGLGFERALYATYLSFLPTDKFAYSLNGHEDERGTFFELLKTIDSGQVSISTTQPGIKRGGHYHNTKNEKFIVVKGSATIRHRQIYGDDIIEYQVSDKKMEVVEMIPGYTHDIKNTGTTEMILLLWANEVFDKDNPDTFYLEV